MRNRGEGMKDKKLILQIISKMYFIIIFLISIIALSIYLYLKGLEKMNIYFYLFGKCSDEIVPYILYLSIFTIVSGITLIIFLKFKHKWVLKISTVLVAILIIFISEPNTFFTPTYRYFEYYSDDNAHHIIVREGGMFHSGFGDIYEMTNFDKMYKVGDYSTNAYLPFACNRFNFEWNEDYFILNYYYGSSGYTENNGYKSIKIKYIK